MAYMKIDNVMIPIFDGSDYSNLKKRIKKFLQFKKCKIVIDRERKRDKTATKRVIGKIWT